MNWKKIEGITYEEKYNDSLILFGPALIDPDFNPTGIVEGFWQEGEGWIAGIWNNDQDCYDTEIVNPTHYCIKEGPKLDNPA